MVGKTYLLAQNLNFRYVFYIESTLFKVMDSDVMLCMFYFYIYYIFNSYYKSAAMYIGSSDKRNHDSIVVTGPDYRDIVPISGHLLKTHLFCSDYQDILENY